MSELKYLKLIVKTGIALTVACFVVGLVDIYAQGNFPLQFVMPGVVLTLFTVYVYVQLGRLKNWARDVVIVFSVLGLIPVFNFTVPLPDRVLGMVSAVFSLFCLIYLLRNDVRQHFTVKTRSPWKVIGFVMLVVLGIIFALIITWLGTLIDFRTGQMTEKGKKIFSHEEVYRRNRALAEKHFGVVIPSDYNVQNMEQGTHVSRMELIVGQKDGMPALETQYIVIYDIKDKSITNMKEAIAFLLGQERTGWIKSLEFGDAITLSKDNNTVDAISIKYKILPGMAGFYNNGRHAIFFVGYAFNKDGAFDSRNISRILGLFD